MLAIEKVKGSAGRLLRGPVRYLYGMSLAGPIRFVKMQGVGNDFVLVDDRAGADRNWPRLALQLCDRRFGVGADGLLVVGESDSADARMRMFNPDGTEDFCGNGLRCVARYVAGEREKRLILETIAGLRGAEVRSDAAGSFSVTVDMGVPHFNPRDVPLNIDGEEAFDYPLPVENETLTATSLSTGTAHTILFVEELPEENRFQRLSSLISEHPLFPERTSIMWTKVESPERLRMRIWERGAGETWGCGTGACAAAVAAIRKKLAQSPVTVSSRGGDLRIAWREGEDIRMTGPAEYVFKGVYTSP